MNRTDHKPVYAKSWALVIGIDDYQFAPKLTNAYNDASAISKLLVERFGFCQENIIELYNQEATRDNISRFYLSFASQSKVSSEDRLLVFFAGHGCTQKGNRGEVGYLVPVDGKIDVLSSLIRWDNLSRDAEMIPAKHLLIILDACFSGLIISRAVQPGGSRFLKDMLKRHSRQVLTAGKADEPVSDAGGPIQGHSIFTGHLIKALSGGAMSESGVLTANGVMAYVTNKVSQDQCSRQSPHYGYFDGDGDFIFCRLARSSLIRKEMSVKISLLKCRCLKRSLPHQKKSCLLKTLKSIWLKSAIVSNLIPWRQILSELR